MSVQPAWLAALPGLVSLHHHESLGVAWRLRPEGIQVGLSAPVRSPGEPQTVRRVWGWFGPAIQKSAIANNVPVELIVACICAESAGGKHNLDDVRGAERQEPGYVSDDDTPGKISVGCMQTLLSTARDMMGGTLMADDLIDPAVSIEAGTRYISHQAAATKYDPPLVGAAYNAGSLRHDSSRANRWRLVCYPLGTGRHIETFVTWFNDALSLGVQPAGDAPSFARALAV